MLAELNLNQSFLLFKKTFKKTLFNTRGGVYTPHNVWRDPHPAIGCTPTGTHSLGSYGTPSR